MATNNKRWTPESSRKIEERVTNTNTEDTTRQYSTRNRSGGGLLRVSELEGDIHNKVTLTNVMLFVKNQHTTANKEAEEGQKVSDSGQKAFGFVTINIGGLFKETFNSLSVIRNSSGDERVVLPYQENPRKGTDAKREQCEICGQYKVVGEKDYRRYTTGDISSQAASLFAVCYLQCKSCENLIPKEKSATMFMCNGNQQDFDEKGNCSKRTEKDILSNQEQIVSEIADDIDSISVSDALF